MKNPYSPCKLSVWTDYAYRHANDRGPLVSTVGDLDISDRGSRNFPGSAPGLDIRMRPVVRIPDFEGDNCYNAWLELQGAHIDLGHFPHRIYITGFTAEVAVSETIEMDERDEPRFTPKSVEGFRPGLVVIVIEPVDPEES